MKQSKNRKESAFYFAVILLALGLILPATISSTLPAYVAFASGLTTLCGLYFGTNVWQKKVTQPAYIKELELNGGDNGPHE
jgi:hypothetical protein